MGKTAAPDYRRRRRLTLLVLIVIGVGIGGLLLRLGPINLIWPKTLSALGYVEDALESVERIQPPTTDSRLLRARLLFAKGDFTACSRAFLEVGPETTGDLVMLGQSMARQGRWSESIPVLQAAEEDGELPVSAYRDLADGYAFLGDYQKSKEYVDTLDQLGDRAHALYRYGLLDRELNRPESFIRNWTELVAIADDAPDLPQTTDELRVTLARICLELVMVDEAEEAVAGVAESAGQQDALGDIAAFRGDRGTAQQHWRRALELDPALYDTREALARSLLEESRFADALEILSPLQDQKLTWTAEVCTAFQLAYAGIGDEENAARWLTRLEEAQRQLEEVRGLMRVASQTGSPMARAVRAWKLASTGNRHQASLIIGAMEEQLTEETRDTRLGRYVRLLASAMRTGQELPNPADYLLDSDASDGEESSETDE